MALGKAEAQMPGTCSGDADMEASRTKVSSLRGVSQRTDDGWGVRRFLLVQLFKGNRMPLSYFSMAVKLIRGGDSLPWGQLKAKGRITFSSTKGVSSRRILLSTIVE